MFEGLNHTVGQEGFHAVDPYILGGAVDEKYGITKAQFADGVSIDNIQVDLVQKALGGRESLTAVPLA